MEHGSGEWDMDLVVPFEMEHGSHFLKVCLSIVHLVGLVIVHLVELAVVHSFQCVSLGSSFLNWPICLSGVQSIMTFVAFGVQTPMQVTLFLA